MEGSSRSQVMGQPRTTRKRRPIPGPRQAAERAAIGAAWALALLGLLGPASPARAAEIGGSHLDVARGQGALDCPDEERFARQVTAIAGQTIEQGLRIQVEFGRHSSGFEAILRVSGPRQGLRTLTDPGPSCAALADAAAVTVAILLDPQASQQALPPPAASQASPARPPPPRDERAQILLGLGPALTGGLTALPAPGITLAASRRPVGRGPGLEGGALWLPGRSFPLADPRAGAPDSGEVQVSLLAARGAGCWWSGAGSLRAAACAEVAAGAYVASGLRYYRTQDSTGLWVGAGPALRVAGAVAGTVGWGAGAGWFFPIHRHDFVIDRVGTAFEAPALGGWVVQGSLEAALW